MMPFQVNPGSRNRGIVPFTEFILMLVGVLSLKNEMSTSLYVIVPCASLGDTNFCLRQAATGKTFPLARILYVQRSLNRPDA